jgi:hypothetical protein
MGRAALCVVCARLIQAQLAIDGQAHVGRITIFLAVVLPPAHRAKLHCLWSIEGFVSAARAAKAGCDSFHG